MQVGELEAGRAPGRSRPAWPQLPAAYWLALTVIAAVGAALRLHGLGALPLNFDEGATSYFAHLPFRDLWGPPARLETNPPLFYTVEHGVVLLLGNGAGTLRLASVTAGVLCVPVAALIARRLGGGRAAGLAAGLLVATSAISVVSSQDARTYSMLTLAALVAIAAEIWLLEAYRGPGPRSGSALAWAWACYVIASLAALYLHNTAVVMVVALNLVASLCWVSMLGAQRRFAVHWIAANAAIVALFAFWLPVIASQSVHALANFWLPVPTLTDLRYAMMNIYAQLYMRALQPVPDVLFLAVGFAGVAFYRSNRIVLGLAAFVVLGVPTLSWLISQWRPIMNGKTLLWLVPVFLVLVALGCTHVRRLAVPLIVLLVAVQLAGCYRLFQTRWDEAFPEVASLLRASALDKDVIYLDSPSDEILLNYYGWPRDRLRVYATPGPDPWYRSFDGTPLAVADAGRLDREPRVWVLTRANQTEHRALTERLSGTMTETLDRKFGHGLLRNMALRNLELSLFLAKPE